MVGCDVITVAGQRISIRHFAPLGMKVVRACERLWSVVRKPAASILGESRASGGAWPTAQSSGNLDSRSGLRREGRSRSERVDAYLTWADKAS